MTLNINSQIFWLEGTSLVMSGTIFFICSISAISAPLAAPRISAWQAAPQKTKRIHIHKEGVVSKSRPAVMNISFIATSCSTASSPIASKSPGMPIASGKPDSSMSIESSSFDAASTSQVRLKDAYLGGLMEKQRLDPSHQEEEEEEDSDNPAAETWYCKGESVVQNDEAGAQPLARGASSSVDQESQKNTEATWDHYLQISPDTSHYMEAVFSMVRKIYGKQPGDPMEDLNVNLAIRRMFMNTTLRAAVHLGKDYDMILRFVKELSLENNGTEKSWSLVRQKPLA